MKNRADLMRSRKKEIQAKMKLVKLEFGNEEHIKLQTLAYFCSTFPEPIYKKCNCNCQHCEELLVVCPYCLAESNYYGDIFTDNDPVGHIAKCKACKMTVCEEGKNEQFDEIYRIISLKNNV